MVKVNFVWVKLLVVTIATTLSALPILAVVRQQPQSSVTGINSRYIAFSWSDIWNVLRRQRVPAGGRGGAVCAITPQKLVDPSASDSAEMGSWEIWSDRPLFLWHTEGGTVQRIELFVQGNEKSFWWQDFAKGETKVVYDGQRLQPGQSYEWRLTTLAPNLVVTGYRFRVMESQKRDRIADELSQLKTAGASEDKIALEKANYFTQQGLWSDALQEIYSVQHPSAELTQVIQQIPASGFCGDGSSR